MQINRSDLLKALEKVKPGLANKEFIEQSTSFAFMGDRVVTFNNEISLTFPVQNLNLTGAIQADGLYKLLSKLKKEEINLEIEKEQILLTCGKVKAGIALQNEIRLPLEEVGSLGRWKPIPENLLTGLQFALHATSNDLSKPILTCVHINQKGFVESTDNYRICKYELRGKWPLSNTLIPADSVREIIKINPSNVTSGKGWIHFMNEENCVLSCRIYDEDSFVDIDNMLSNVKGETIQFPQTILSALEKAELFTMTGVINIDIKDNKIKIHTANETGWIEEELNIRFKHELKFGISPRLIKDILEVTKKGIINDRVVFFNVPNEFQYLIALAKRQ